MKVTSLTYMHFFNSVLLFYDLLDPFHFGQDPEKCENFNIFSHNFHNFLAFIVVLILEVFLVRGVFSTLAENPVLRTCRQSLIPFPSFWWLRFWRGSLRLFCFLFPFYIINRTSCSTCAGQTEIPLSLFNLLFWQCKTFFVAR